MTSKDIGQRSIELHRKLRGKISVVAKTRLRTNEDLATLYTPGMGAVSSAIAKHPKLVVDYTGKSNTVAVISDGSAVLGLGNVGAAAAIPVMEGKALLFSELAGLNAWPIVLDTQDANEIIATIKHIAPVFGGVNLEDIAAPKCFAIERRLATELDIPIVHDDQHATAIVVLAGLVNALKVAGKDKAVKIVIIGAGAAGNGTAKLLATDGFTNILVLDSRGILSRRRRNLDQYKQEIAAVTNPENIDGNLDLALRGADVLIGLSQGGIVQAHHVRTMNQRAIVFAMANPVPEIMPDVAKAAGAYIVATGRSDFANQINNVLVFPGLFAGLLGHKVRRVSDDMKQAAAYELAGLVARPTRGRIIPSVFDRRVVPTIAAAIDGHK